MLLLYENRLWGEADMVRSQVQIQKGLELNEHLYSEPRSNAGKPTDRATQLGQVFTPSEIADRMVAEISPLVGNWQDTTVLDPCVGHFALPNAILRSGIKGFRLKACELDPIGADVTDSLIVKNLHGNPLVVRGDFLDLNDRALGQCDVAIANPPYIRQEWIEKKTHYRHHMQSKYGVKIPGTANLYVYFIVKLIQHLREGGVFSFIVYDSWTYTRYGRWLVEYLNQTCNSISSITVKNTPFEGHLIDATIIVGRRSSLSENCTGNLKIEENNVHHEQQGFVPLGLEYWTKRGLRLKQASFFMGSSHDILKHGATRFVKKPQKLSALSVSDDHPESALLIFSKEPPNQTVLAEIERRLDKASIAPESNKSILNWFNKRPDNWKTHSKPPIAPILFNYYFRNRPRHIYNPLELPYADNYYGVRPINGLPNAVAFALLNATSTVVALQACSRRQGNGLRKLQLFEYRNVWIPGASLFNSEQIGILNRLGLELASMKVVDLQIVACIDRVVYEATERCSKFEPTRLIGEENNFWRNN